MRLDVHPNGGSDPDFVQSLARGLAVITAFSSERPAMTLTEVAQATGLTRAAARRFLLTLHRLGYVYIPMGMNAARWTPQGEGRIAELSPSFGKFA